MSTTKVVDLKNFSKELGNFSKLSLAKKREAVADGVAKSIPLLVKASPVDTGLFAASWDMKVADKSVTVGNYAPYAGVVEYGARPFKPPIAPLLAWAHRVLRGQKNPETGHLYKRGQPLTNAEVKKTGNSPLDGYSSDEWRLAVGTQKKIEAQGIRPHHIMEKMIPTILRLIKGSLKNV